MGSKKNSKEMTQKKIKAEQTYIEKKERENMGQSDKKSDRQNPKQDKEKESPENAIEVRNLCIGYKNIKAYSIFCT